MMQEKDAEELVSKAMKVILSCETLDQLNIATNYSRLVYKRLGQEIGLIKSLKLVCMTEVSIGFALCQVGGGKIKDYISIEMMKGEET